VLKLRGAFSQNPRLAPLLDGTVKLDGIEIEWELGTPGPMFHRHLKDNEFDVFEFSLSDYMIVHDRPHLRERGWTAIPIFLSRAFLALNSYVNVHSGVETLADLKGKSFGIPDFTMTAGLWMRAMIDELYGVRAQDVAWYNGRPFETSHGVLMGLDKDPPRVQITWLDRGALVNEKLHSGEIAAAYGDASDVQITEDQDVARLFHDGGKSFVEDFYRKTGFTPVNHTVVVQQRILEREPWAAMALYDAFERSKQEAYRRDPQRAYMLFAGTDRDAQAATFGPDPYPSGLTANRAMLQMAAKQSFEEGLTHNPAEIDNLFWESVRTT
jgi:4,5-dihydroxyphthalate decarboxylase